MIYLDNASTTKPHKEVVDLVTSMLRDDFWGNPNSSYEFSLKSRRLIEQARITIANKINCLPEEIIFTPSSSAANALAICGYMNKHDDCKNWITTNLEHSSISNIEVKHKNKYIVNCNHVGFVEAEQFADYRNCLVSVVGANSEIGTIQPIKEISKTLHRNGNIFHSDLTAYFPYLNVDVKDLGVDMCTLSSHKIHGLKNCGVLYVKKGVELSPIVFGHGTLWGGTEDVYQICAMAKAVEMLNYDTYKDIERKRNYFLDKLSRITAITLNGSLKNRLPNNVNFFIDNATIDNQQLVAMCDLMGFAISAGTACSSGSKEPSKTLLAIGLTPSEANKSVRVTISADTTYEDIDKFINVLEVILTQFAC